MAEEAGLGAMKDAPPAPSGPALPVNPFRRLSRTIVEKSVLGLLWGRVIKVYGSKGARQVDEPLRSPIALFYSSSD